MKILQVKKFPLYDVFLYDGWTNWSRVKVQDGSITVIAGAALTPDVIGQISNFVKEHK